MSMKLIEITKNLVESKTSRDEYESQPLILWTNNVMMGR